MPAKPARELEPGPETRAYLRRLIALWDKNPKSTFELIDGRRPIGPMIVHALTLHTVHTSRAVLHLYEAGMHLESMPLIRLSIENAVTATWLALSDDAGLALTHEGAKQRKLLLEEILKTGFEINESNISAMVGVINDLDEYKNGASRIFEQRCQALAGGQVAYAAWRAASGLSHAGISLAESYMLEVPVREKGVGISIVEYPGLTSIEHWLAIQTRMLAMCLIACDMLRKTPRHREQLDRAAFDLQVPRVPRLAEPRSSKAKNSSAPMNRPSP